MRILVLDGSTRASLAITRSLGREGMEVIVGAEKHPSLASVSKYCSERFIYPDPQKNFKKFTAAICQAVEEINADVLLPVTDITTLMVSENKKLLEKQCFVPFPDFESVSQASNKFTLMKMAEKLGIPIPKTIYLACADDLEDSLSQCRSLGYPIVVKPSRSVFPHESGWRKTSVKYADNEKELMVILSEQILKNELPVLLQEKIEGEGTGSFLCLDHGEVITAFSHRRIREKPPSGGVSVLRESIPLKPILRKYAEKILKYLEWHGIAMVEFKKDDRAGDYKLMEINGRFWGSLQLAIDAGVNFPLILVNLASGKKNSPIHNYRMGVKTRWLWGDVDALLSRLLKTDAALHLPDGHPGRVQAVIDFLKFRERDLHYEVIDRQDLKPWLFESFRWFGGR